MSRLLSHLTVSELASRIRTGQLGCIEATQFMLERIHHHNPHINCYIDIFDKAAIESATLRDMELEQGIDKGPLHGIPVAIKDIFDMADHRASGGSKIPRNHSDHTARVVSALEEAGAVILGTLNMDELAAGGSGENIHFGRCKNPWNPTHVTGGSSGGSASAVAAGLAYAAIGSDAGGSVRIPAAFCGAVGLKPTYGRVSRFGALARTWSMDCIGPITRSTTDAALLFNAILGRDEQDPTSVSSNPVDLDFNEMSIGKVGVFTDSEMHEPGFTRAQTLMKNLGYSMAPLELTDLKRYTELQQVIVKSEGASLHEQALHDPDSKMSFAVRSVIEGGLEIPATRYIEALSLRESLLHSFCKETMGDVDLLMMPVSLPFAPKHNADDHLAAEKIDQEFSRLATLTRFANYLGIPAISVPSHINSEGLPGAIQLIAKPFQEAKLLHAAALFETERGPINYPLQQDPK